MRHQYTPIFRDMLTSSLWASSSPATRCVWMTLLLMADPEGYVPASVPGLALAANVTLEECMTALAILEGPDPHSRTKDHEGRRVQAVDHGWFVYNFVSWRARAVAEAEKARKRHWAASHRAKPANDNASLEDVTSTCSGSSETLDSPKPKPKPKSSSPKKEKGTRETRSPRPVPEVDVEEVQTRKAVWRDLDGWEPSDELKTEAQHAGIPPTYFDEKLADLRTGPIGGNRGVTSRDNYVRAQFPKWRRWYEQEQLKAQRAAAMPPSSRFGQQQVAPPPPSRPLVPGAPQWVYAEHADFAKQNGLDVARAAKAYARQSHVPIDCLKPQDVRKPFQQYLANLVKARAVA